MKFSLWLEAKVPAPWIETGIGKNALLPDAPVIMIDIKKIKPIHGRNNRQSKPVDPKAPYQPVIINNKSELQDGYHRYYSLLDSGYKGQIPAVIY